MITEDQTTEQALPVEKQELEINTEIKGLLTQTGKWARFLAIIGFVIMGLMVVVGFIMGIVMSFLPTGQADVLPFRPFLISFVYVIFAAIYFFPLLYLFRFSTGIKEALYAKKQSQFAKAIKNLKSHYRFIGILMIVMLALYALMFVVMLFTGFLGGMAALGTLAA
jgi:hypothetical protein